MRSSHSLARQAAHLAPPFVLSLCSHYARVTGTGTGRRLTVVTLGGAAYGWEQQCDPASYQSIRNFDTKSVCESLPDSKAAYNTTIVGTYTTTSTQGSDAASFGVATLSGLAALGAAVLLG